MIADLTFKGTMRSDFFSSMENSAVLAFFDLINYAFEAHFEYSGKDCKEDNSMNYEEYIAMRT